jgi:hypothetical protein
MFNFFRRRPTSAFRVLGRYGTGDWFKSFIIEAPSAYEACRQFDTSEDNLDWVRVSGATLVN